MPRRHIQYVAVEAEPSRARCVQSVATTALFELLETRRTLAPGRGLERAVCGTTTPDTMQMIGNQPLIALEALP